MAKPDSSDPVEHRSTRVTCVGPYHAQTSYDPRFIKKHIGGSDISSSALPPFYGLAPEEFDTPKAHKLYEAASPINNLSKDDPPVFIFFPNDTLPVPLPTDAPEKYVIHHPQFGVILKQQMDLLRIRCELRLGKDYAEDRSVRYEAGFSEMVKFFDDCFKEAR